MKKFNLSGVIKIPTPNKQKDKLSLILQQRAVRLASSNAAKKSYLLNKFK